MFMSSKPLKIVSLPGDGIGPEVCAQALRVLRVACERAGRGLEVAEFPMGGVALDAGEAALPERTRQAAVSADAVLLGAVGLPKYDGQPGERRPEKGLLDLRKALGVFANLRPVRTFPSLLEQVPLKPEIVQGVDLLVVRELLGDVYFGEPRLLEAERAYNTMSYTADEVRRVARVAFKAARKRRGRVHSIDKANVLEVSQLWRRTVTAVWRDEFPDVTLEHQYVDSAAMDLISKPKKFDVIVTGNLFGDILTDEAAVLAGSIGLLASASLGDGPGLFEPIHGSAPDIAGKNIANPIGAIGSVASLLDAVGLAPQAREIEAAIERVLSAGHRTRDLGGQVSTDQMGSYICQALQSQ
jgi:3-isopropylmalate dehydrogenase